MAGWRREREKKRTKGEWPLCWKERERKGSGKGRLWCGRVGQRRGAIIHPRRRAEKRRGVPKERRSQPSQSLSPRPTLLSPFISSRDVGQLELCLPCLGARPQKSET